MNDKHLDHFRSGFTAALLILALNAYSFLEIAAAGTRECSNRLMNGQISEQISSSFWGIELSRVKDILGVIEEENLEARSTRSSASATDHTHISNQYMSLDQSCRQERSSRSSSRVQYRQYSAMSTHSQAILRL